MSNFIFHPLGLMGFGAFKLGSYLESYGVHKTSLARMFHKNSSYSKYVQSDSAKLLFPEIHNIWVEASKTTAEDVQKIKMFYRPIHCVGKALILLTPFRLSIQSVSVIGLCGVNVSTVMILTPLFVMVTKTALDFLGQSEMKVSLKNFYKKIRKPLTYFPYIEIAYQKLFKGVSMWSLGARLAEVSIAMALMQLILYCMEYLEEQTFSSSRRASIDNPLKVLETLVKIEQLSTSEEKGDALRQLAVETKKIVYACTVHETIETYRNVNMLWQRALEKHRIEESSLLVEARIHAYIESFVLIR